MQFVTTLRRAASCSWAVRGESPCGRWRVSLYLDSMDGDVLYPVIIKDTGPSGMAILLEGEEAASAMLPAILPGHLVPPLTDSLAAFTPVVDAARAWMEEEIRLYKNRT